MNAAPSGYSASVENVSLAGCITKTTPAKPIITANHRTQPTTSPSNGTASAVMKSALA